MRTIKNESDKDAYFLREAKKVLTKDGKKAFIAGGAYWEYMLEVKNFLKFVNDFKGKEIK